MSGIRLMTTADLPDASAIKQQVFGDLYAGHITQERIDAYLASAASVEALARRLADPERRLVVYEVGHEIIGGAILDLRPGEPGYLNSVWVAPQHQGQGYGLELAQWRERTAAAEGFTRLRLHVWDRNEVGREFATSRRYVRTGETLWCEKTDSVLLEYERDAPAVVR